MRLTDYLLYDKKTGKFFWRKPFNPKACSRVKIGAEAGSVEPNGYRRIRLGSVRYHAHRLAWFFAYGAWPTLVDHINGDTLDNRIENLREATSRQNQSNMWKHRRGHLVGTSYNKTHKKWLGRIYVGGTSVFLGWHKTQIGAHKAYQEFKKQGGLV
jgi:hypothetical protein